MANREKEQQLNEDIFKNAVESADAVRPTYAATFDDQLGEIYDKIQNREPFSYDINKDPFFDMYKDKYIQQGKLAMKDTMGQAAALTGGYGSTYGQQVGQQAYDAQLQNLSDVIPKLYSMAYSMYQDEGDNLLNLYTMTGDLRDQEYGRYRDDLSDYNYNQEVRRQLEDLLYSRRINEENTAWTRQQQESQSAWERQQANYKNLMNLISTTAYQPTDAELAAAGMSRGEADAAWAQALREWAVKMDQVYGTGGSSGGSGGGGSSGRSGGGGGGGYRSGSDIAALQRQLNAMGENLDVDGVLGPLTQAAAARHGISIGSGVYTPTSTGNTGSTGNRASYNLGELADASAAGASKSQIEQALKARGVDTSSAAVQQDIKWALSK